MTALLFAYAVYTYTRAHTHTHLIKSAPVLLIWPCSSSVWRALRETREERDKICRKPQMWQHERKLHWSWPGVHCVGKKLPIDLAGSSIGERGERILLTHLGQAIYNPWVHPFLYSLFLLSLSFIGFLLHFTFFFIPFFHPSFFDVNMFW